MIQYIHWENYVSISFHSEWDMIVVTIFEPNGIPFGSKSKGKLVPRSYPIQCGRKWKHSFLSVPVPQVGGINNYTKFTFFFHFWSSDYEVLQEICPFRYHRGQSKAPWSPCIVLYCKYCTEGFKVSLKFCLHYAERCEHLSNNRRKSFQSSPLKPHLIYPETPSNFPWNPI